MFFNQPVASSISQTWQPCWCLHMYVDGELTYRYEKEDHAAEGEATGVA